MTMVDSNYYIRMNEILTILTHQSHLIKKQERLNLLWEAEILNQQNQDFVDKRYLRNSMKVLHPVKPKKKHRWYSRRRIIPKMNIKL